MYQAPREKQVSESMISTVSEAFQFEDFLGERTTLKDRVPKNKADPNKKIIHFSREVTVDYASGSNALSSYSYQAPSLQKSSTFDNYMSQDYYKKPFFTDMSPSKTYEEPYYNKVSTEYNQSSNYGRYESPKYTDYSSYSFKKESTPSSNYSQSAVNQFSPQQQIYPQNTNYEASKNVQQFSYNNIYTNPYSNIQSNQNQSYGHFKSDYKPTFETKLPQLNYNFTPSNYSQKQSTNAFNYESNTQRPYSTPPTAYSTDTYIVNNNNNKNNSTYNSYNTYNNSNTNYTSTSQAPERAQSSYNRAQQSNRYSSYGDYSQDFSSSDIMQIIMRRRKAQA